MDHYAVFGNPVSHSLSPTIHSLFAKQFGHEIDYQAILVEPGEFKSTTDNFFSRGGLGLSITVPFKQDAYEFADVITDRAKQAEAVNTLSYDGKQTLGDNTDGIGLVNDLLNNHLVEIQDRSVLVLGAGGAVKGILGPMIDQHPESIAICNRTVSKAETLADKFNASAVSYDQLHNQSFDIVINGTSSSLQNQLPPIPETVFNKAAVSYDMMYSNEPTIFQSWSRRCGVKRAYDGLGMLVEQAAEAFYIWRGVQPDTKQIIEQLRKL